MDGVVSFIVWTNKTEREREKGERVNKKAGHTDTPGRGTAHRVVTTWSVNAVTLVNLKNICALLKFGFHYNIQSRL